MDGHQHAHVAPNVWNAFISSLSGFGIKMTRLPIELGLEDAEMKLGQARYSSRVGNPQKKTQNITKTHEYFVIFCGFWLIFEPTNFFRVISIFVGFCGLFCEILWVFVGHKIFLWVFVGFVYEKSQQKYENFLHFS